MAKLLVVDDDTDVLEALCNMLNAAHAVERASDGFAALKIIEKDAPFDLLLTDIKMAGKHGFALARMAVARRPELRVLYISGHLGEIGADDAAKFGPGAGKADPRR
jgi:DNA-binding NtrC family response regulator